MLALARISVRSTLRSRSQTVQVYLFEALLATLEERLLNLRVPLRRLPLRRLIEHVVVEEVNGVIDPLSLRKAWRLLKSTLRV
jgi:hypothetical protein